MIKIIKKIWNVLKYILATVFFGISAIFLLKNKKNVEDEKKQAEKAREEKKNELEEKTADDIAADSPNPDTISANIDREQKELRERIRNRLNQNIPGNRSSSDN